ncbi:hypothetical protein AgCh_030973 [Apium graveolens]
MFKNYCKYKRKEMTMEDLILRLRIEEDNRGSEKKMNVATEKANMVEHVESFKPKKSTSVGHTSSDCKKPKKANKKKKANMVDHVFKEMGDIDNCTKVSEVNLVGFNPRFYVVSYAVAIYILNLLIGFLSPQVDPELQALDHAPTLPIRASDEFRPFVRRLPEFKFWCAFSNCPPPPF